MRTDDVKKYAKQTPFEPFRITLTDGRTYDVTHPDLIMVGRSSVTIGVPTESEEDVYDRSVMVSLLHIMQIEVLNGQEKQ